MEPRSHDSLMHVDQAPDMSFSRSHERLAKRRFLRDLPARMLALALACSIAWQPMLAMAQEAIQLPDLGSTGEVLPPDEARTFPNEFKNYLRSQDLLVDDPVVESYFTQMGYRLVMHSDGRDRRFTFHVLKVPGINAFAAPAGVVALNAGLVLAADSADEVAGVVAHEISHVTQNHLLRGMEEAQRVSLPVMLATLGLVLAGSMAGMDGDTAQGILSTGMGLSQQAQINYTRQNEAEADRIGIQLMARAGYSPVGMADFFETLNRWSRSQGSGPPEYLRTHPLTISRVAEARDRAEKIKHEKREADLQFDFVQARLRVTMSQHHDHAIAYFEQQLQNQPRNPAALRYGLALALINARQTDRADDEVKWLLAREPDNQLFRLLRADLLIADGNIDGALAEFERLYENYGQSGLIALSYADALLHSGNTERAAKAAEILRVQMRRDPDNTKITELLAHAADRAGDEIRAAEAVAANYYQRGGLPQAIEQLERVLRRNDLDYYDRARISSKLDRMRVERLRSTRQQQ
ncbi:MAG: M48 family metalloprotease [Wenzhouxiangellaceae bacterium]|nr:M48 family metalloprotease [Wenzhouxiangellaceae bacterium]